MKVKGNHPLAEIIAKCMSGVETVPKEVIRRMVNRACREAVKYHEAALQSHNTGNPKLLDAYSRLEDWCWDNQQHNETVMEILDELDQLRASA